MSDRRKPNRNEQRRARALAASEGISYMQALGRIRTSSARREDWPRPGIFRDQCENVLGRRGIIGGMYSHRPSHARLVADALAHAQELLRARVIETSGSKQSIERIADAAKMLAGAALAAIDPEGRVQTPGQLARLVLESPSQIPWWDLPATQQYLEDTREWWSRIDPALAELGDREEPRPTALRVVLRLAVEYAFWSETGVAELPPIPPLPLARDVLI